MCLALLTLTSSSIDIVKQKSNSGEVGIFSYSPGLVLVFCSLFIVASWFMRENRWHDSSWCCLYCRDFLHDDDVDSHALAFQSEAGLEYNQSKNPARSIPHPHSPWNCLRRGEFSTSKGFDIRGCHRYRICSSSLERIFHDESVEGFTILHRQICKTTFSICIHRILSVTLLSLVSIAPIWTGHEGIANIQPTHWLLIAYSCFFVVCGFAIFLHEDHLHYSPSTRITHWHLVLMFLACGVLMTWSLYDGAVLLDGEYLPVYIWIGTQSVASLLLAILFIRHTVFPSDNWHRMPMFYDRLMESND